MQISLCCSLRDPGAEFAQIVKMRFYDFFTRHSQHNFKQMENKVAETAKRIHVKVFGFSQVEREALESVFQLSESRSTTYSVWRTDMHEKAILALVDGDSWEASLALANPENDTLMLVWIGDNPPPHAWRFFPRPLAWDTVVKVMDYRYASEANLTTRQVTSVVPAVGTTGAAKATQDDHAHLVTEPMQLEATSLAPGGRTLIVEADRATRLYWRAKLSAIGRSIIDEAPTAEVARHLVRFNVYHLVVIDLHLPDLDSWTLVKEINKSRPPVGHLVVTGANLYWLDSVRAWFAGAKNTLPKPFHPVEVRKLFKKLSM